MSMIRCTAAQDEPIRNSMCVKALMSVGTNVARPVMDFPDLCLPGTHSVWYKPDSSMQDLKRSLILISHLPPPA